MTADTMDTRIETVKAKTVTMADKKAIDPIKFAALLTNSGLFDEYLVYEKNGDYWFAGGVIRSISLYADRIETKYENSTSVRKITQQKLYQAVAEELKSWTGPWQACGWACFEFAYALKAPELLNEDERLGKVPLLYLCQPKASVSFDNEQIKIDTNIEDLHGQISELLKNPNSYPTPAASGVEIPDNQEYRQAVSNSLKEINQGTLEKVILSRRLPLDFTPNFIDTWLLGRQKNTPARSFLLNLNGWQTCGFSPEIVMSVDQNRQVTTEPLAGTCRLDGLAETDLSRFNGLYSDPKETHEHAISVRLAVEEMAEICTPNTIAVREFMERKERGSVQHLASTVCGELRDDCNAWDAFASLFPSVTASGIPKRQAFAEIRRQEPSSRGLYAGSVLRVSHDGSMDAALVLRSLLGQGQQAWLQAGAGIVSASAPERELTETSEKLASISPWVVRKK